MDLLADIPSFFGAGSLQETTNSTLDCPLVYCCISMFLPRLINISKLVQLAVEQHQTLFILSHECICGQLWANAQPSYRIPVSYPTVRSTILQWTMWYYSGSRIPVSHPSAPLLWTTWYISGFQDLAHLWSAIVNFFTCSGYKDLNRLSWTFGVTRANATRTRFSKPLLYHWNWGSP